MSSPLFFYWKNIIPRETKAYFYIKSSILFSFGWQVLRVIEVQLCFYKNLPYAKKKLY